MTKGRGWGAWQEHFHFSVILVIQFQYEGVQTGSQAYLNSIAKLLDIVTPRYHKMETLLVAILISIACVTL